MKFTKALLITGTIFAVGGVAYAVYKQLGKKNDNTDNLEIVTVPNEEEILFEHNSVQTEATDSVKERHAKASQQIKGTITEMVNDNSAFEENVEQLNNELNDLLN